jgi:ribosome recycling factor
MAISQNRIDDLRERIAKDHDDPRSLHDEVQALVDDMHASHDTVPADLREAVEELEAEIVEEFYDNLPV